MFNTALFALHTNFQTTLVLTGAVHLYNQKCGGDRFHSLFRDLRSVGVQRARAARNIVKPCLKNFKLRFKTCW